MGRRRTKISDKPLTPEDPIAYTAFVKFNAWPKALRDEEFGYSSDSAFAKKYKVSPDTLSNWKGRTQFYNDVNKQLMTWGRGYTPDVMASVLKNILRNGSAPESRLWLEVFEKLKEQGNAAGLNRETLQTIQNLTRALLEQEKKK